MAPVRRMLACVECIRVPCGALAKVKLHSTIMVDGSEREVRD